jgi:hypothetical protein
MIVSYLVKSSNHQSDYHINFTFTTFFSFHSVCTMFSASPFKIIFYIPKSLLNSTAFNSLTQYIHHLILNAP